MSKPKPTDEEIAAALEVAARVPWRPVEQPQDGPVSQCSRLYFTDDFLSHPPPGWWATLPKIADNKPGPDGFFHMGWIGYPKGTTVHYRCPHVHALWRLTGSTVVLWTATGADAVGGRDTVAFEGRWPD